MAQDDATITIDLTSQPGDYRCLACGHCGPATVAIFPDDGGPVVALCRPCARDRAALIALIRRTYRAGPGRC